MPVNGSEDQIPSSFPSPVSAALTPGGTEEDGATGGSAVCSFTAKSQGSEGAAAYPVTTGPGEGNNGELYNRKKGPIYPDQSQINHLLFLSVLCFLLSLLILGCIITRYIYIY